MFKLKIKIPKEIESDLTLELEKKFGEEIKFEEELALAEVASIITIVAGSTYIIEKVREYLKSKEDKGEITPGTIQEVK